MPSKSRRYLLLVLVVSCMLASSKPAAAHPGHAHPRKLQQHSAAVGTAETDAAAAELLATAQPTPPEIPADAIADVAAVAAAAAAAPIVKRACGTVEGTRGQRAASERRFQAKVEQLKAAGEDVTVAQAPVIPVYFHVLMLNRAQGTVTQAQINNQIATLNAAYAGVFSFTLVNATWYTTSNQALFNADVDSAGEASIKQQLRKGTARTLNIYTWEPKSSTGTTLGWATFPWSYSGNPSKDGVVLLFSTINGGSLNRYNLGATGVHEVGHWLGLYHTFQGSCGTSDTARSGDFVTDTPAVRTANYKCTRINSCSDNQGDDLIQNFMDYTPDSCMTSFTAGQRDRMQAAWGIYRNSK